MNVSGTLVVQYDKNPSAKKYLSQKGRVEGFLKKGVESHIRFYKPAVGINYAGVLSEDAGIEYEGYWDFEKLANKLPYNYLSDQVVEVKIAFNSAASSGFILPPNTNLNCLLLNAP